MGLRAGALRLMAQDLTIKGRPVPEIYLQKIRTQNLVFNVNSDPQAAAWINAVQDIQVKDGKLLIVPKPNAPAP